MINFKYKNDPSNLLHKSIGILKLNNLALFQNSIFVLKNVRKEQPTTFSILFQISTNEQNHNTRGTKIIKQLSQQ